MITKYFYKDNFCNLFMYKQNNKINIILGYKIDSSQINAISIWSKNMGDITHNEMDLYFASHFKAIDLKNIKDLNIKIMVKNSLIGLGINTNIYKNIKKMEFVNL